MCECSDSVCLIVCLIRLQSSISLDVIISGSTRGKSTSKLAYMAVTRPQFLTARWLETSVLNHLGFEVILWGLLVNS